MLARHSVFIVYFCVLCIHQEYVLDSEELSLGDFIAKYQDELPLHVRVCKGFYGQSERTSVSEGDTFNIHFIKKSQVLQYYKYDNNIDSLFHCIILKTYMTDCVDLIDERSDIALIACLKYHNSSHVPVQAQLPTPTHFLTYA